MDDRQLAAQLSALAERLDARVFGEWGQDAKDRLRGLANELTVFAEEVKTSHAP